LELSEACPDLTVNVSVEREQDAISVVCCPHRLKVPRQKKYVVLEFRLDRDDSFEFTFPSVAAVLVEPGNPQFPVVSWTAPDGTVARLLDFNSDANLHDYTVNVIRRAPYQGRGAIQNGYTPAP
jgi:hypothetical protein